MVPEICVCSATTTLDPNFFANNLAPIVTHTLVIIVFMSSVCMVLMRRWFGEDWSPPALMFLGAGCGSTPSGFALACCVDLDVKTEGWETFGVAQGCLVPVASTLVTILPVIAASNLQMLVEIGTVISAAMIVFNELVVRGQQTARV